MEVVIEFLVRRSDAATPVTQDEEDERDDRKDDEDGPKHDGRYHDQVTFERLRLEKC
jgi:hypothetical protein